MVKFFEIKKLCFFNAKYIPSILVLVVAAAQDIMLPPPTLHVTHV